MHFSPDGPPFASFSGWLPNPFVGSARLLDKGTNWSMMAFAQQRHCFVTPSLQYRSAPNLIPPLTVWSHYRLRKFTMETLPSYQEVPASSARSVSTQVRLEIKSMEISTVMTKCRETTDEELEFIEMRYQQALALVNLESLFAEGLLNC